MNPRLAKTMSPLLHHAGIYRRHWARAAAVRPRVLVACYHRIAARGAEGEPPGFGVERGTPLESFEAQLRFLRRHFEPVAISELADPGGTLPPLGFAVTFDDGYADNLTLAAPVLEHLGVSATIFLNSDFVGTERRFWWEQLGALLRETKTPVLRPSEVLVDLESPAASAPELPLRSSGERENAHWSLSMGLMRTAPSAIDGVLARLADVLETPLRREGRDAPLLDWDGVRAWRAKGHQVGAHGASHANLGLASGDEARREVHDCVVRVSAETDGSVAAFAYPYGGPEHRSPAAIAAVREAGCRVAFTTELGIASNESDPFALPRVGFTRGSHIACAYQTHRAFEASGL